MVSWLLDLTLSCTADGPRPVALQAEEGSEAHRHKVSRQGLMKEISAKWKTMSEEEQHTVTAERVEELRARNKNRLEAIHNVPLAGFQDARITVEKITEEVRLFSFRIVCAHADTLFDS